jgi:Mg2+ and Co2+ transporter CorA
MDDGPDTASVGVAQQASLLTTIVSASGVQHIATNADLRQFVDSGRFFWLDIVGDDAAVRGIFLSELGLAEIDGDWAQRFGQTGRMTIRRGSLRAVTWLSEGRGNLTEIHLLGSSKFILTIWNGDASALDEARARFSELADELEKSPYQAVAIVLQLLLGTLDRAASELDLRLQELQRQLERDTSPATLTNLTGQISGLRSIWSYLDRYESAVRSAFVGIAELPEIDRQGAAELDKYADQVEDVEHRLRERYQWGADIIQDCVAATAQRQSEQINRLTMVSLIFLPITFLTGFFGMNFNWMIDILGSPIAFFCLGLLLPLACVMGTLLWFTRRGLLRKPHTARKPHRNRS